MGTEFLINIFGAVALLLWGLRMARTGVTRAYGAPLRRAISLGTKNRLAAFATGFGVTGVLQSSTATALIVSSFAQSRLIALPAALVVMLGADVGSTLVVQVLSLNISWFSPLLIGGGVVLFMSAKANKQKNLGRICIGLGLMLLSIKLIGLTSAPLRHSETLVTILQPLTTEPVLAVLLAAVLTYLAHSSAAIVLLVASLAGLQLLSMQLAFALILGANLGGAFAPMVLTLGGAPEGRRVALGNLLMRATGVVLCLFAVPWLQPYLALAGEDPLRMAVNFHTAFNLGLALLFLPLTPLVARLATRLLPERAGEADSLKPRYLDEHAIDTPPVALAAAAREALRMGDAVEQMLTRSVEVLTKDNEALRKEIEREDDLVDKLHEAIKLYVTRVSQGELDDEESRRAVDLLNFTTNLEHIGDIIDKNLMELAAKKMKKQISFSEDGLAELTSFHGQVLSNLRLSLNVFMSGDLESARELLLQKTRIRDLEQQLAESHYHRIGSRQPDTLESSALHLDVLRDLKRINGHLTAAAYPILERAGALTDSRLREPALDDSAAEEAAGEIGGAKPA